MNYGHRRLHKGETLTTEEFIEKALKIHGDKYGYQSTEYCGSKAKIKIECKKHGIFHQIPSDHLGGSGCRRCYDDGKKRWSIDQDAFLCDHYQEKGAYWCADQLGKTDHAVRARAVILKLVKKQRCTHAHVPAFIWNSLLGRVKKDGYILDFEVDFIWDLYCRQNGKCALTGWDIVFGRKSKDNTVSIDRIDSDGDYTKGNVQLTHKMVNRCKLNTKEQWFYQMCDAISNHRKADFTHQEVTSEDDIANDTVRQVTKTVYGAPRPKSKVEDIFD